MKRNSIPARGNSQHRSTGRPGSGLRHGRGFGTAELLAGLSLVAVVAGLAAPTYTDAVDKRQIVNDAEHVEHFVNLARSESIKRFSPLTVSYARDESGEWCIGSTLGHAPCDCLETDVTADDFCAIEGAPWILRNRDLQSDWPLYSMEGDGAYAFDPVRGILANPRDSLVLGLSEGNGRFRVELEVRPTGHSALCVPREGEPIRGMNACAPGS